MGRRPDPQLEQRRLDRPAAAHRRQDRARWSAPRRARSSSPTRPRSTCSRCCQRRARACSSADAPARTRDRLRAQQLPDRPLHRRERSPRQRGLRAAAGRRPTRSPTHLDERRRGADADARQLPQRPHARHGRADARRPCRRRARRSGTWRTPPARCRSTCTRAGADFAVGCGYKYLNGGPGAPAFVWVHPRTRAHGPRELRQPLSGWLRPCGAVRVRADYRPAAGIARFLCGTPPVLSLARARMRRRTCSAAEASAACRAARQVDRADRALHRAASRRAAPASASTLASPRDAAERGSQVSFAHAGRLRGRCRR